MLKRITGRAGAYMWLLTHSPLVYIHFWHKVFLFIWIFTACYSVSGSPNTATVIKARCYANCLTKVSNFYCTKFFLQAATPYDLSSVQCCRAFWSTNRQHCRESIELSGRYIDELTAYGIFLINRKGRLLNFGLWDWNLFRHKRLFEAGRPLNFHHFFLGGGGCGAYSNKYGVLRATRCSLRAPLQLNQSNSVLWKSSSEQHRVNSVVSSSSSVNCRPLSVEWIL